MHSNACTFTLTRTYVRTRNRTCGGQRPLLATTFWPLCCTLQASAPQHAVSPSFSMRFSAVQYSTVQYSTVQYSTVQYSKVQYSTVQYSTGQDSTVQCSTVRHSTHSDIFGMILIKVRENLPEGGVDEPRRQTDAWWNRI